MKKIFGHLSHREKIMVALACSLILVFLGHTFVVSPVLQRLEFHQERIPVQRELLAWMEKAAAEVEKLRGDQRSFGKEIDEDSLLSAIDTTAKEHGLGNGIKRVEPGGGGRASIWFEGVIFDDMLMWLAILHEKYSLTVVEISVDRGKDPGYVDAQIVVDGGLS